MCLSLCHKICPIILITEKLNKIIINSSNFESEEGSIHPELRSIIQESNNALRGVKNRMTSFVSIPENK